jgi:hypothetical protein
LEGIRLPRHGWTDCVESGDGATGRGSMPAYYDARLFTITFKEEPGGADACEPAGFMFTSVLDAIKGDGFNPLGQEVQITFDAGHTPRQLLSDDAITAAAAGSPRRRSAIRPR